MHMVPSSWRAPATHPKKNQQPTSGCIWSCAFVLHGEATQEKCTCWRALQAERLIHYFNMMLSCSEMYFDVHSDFPSLHLLVYVCSFIIKEVEKVKEGEFDDSSIRRMQAPRAQLGVSSSHCSSVYGSDLLLSITIDVWPSHQPRSCRNTLAGSLHTRLFVYSISDVASFTLPRRVKTPRTGHQ